MDLLRLGIIASSTTEEENSIIKNALSLAILCSEDAWSLVEPATANLLLIWINTEKDLMLLHGLQAKYPSERLIVLANNEFSVQARWYLPFLMQNVVPNILSLVGLLTRVQSFFLPAFRTEIAKDYNPYDFLPTIVKNALADNKGRICSYPTCPEVYLFPNENSFYFSGRLEQLIPMVLAGYEDIFVEEATDQQIIKTVNYVKFSSRLSSYLTVDDEEVFENIEVKKFKRYSLTELIWFAILIGSRGRLIKGNSIDEKILLKQLPEYLRLDYYGKEYRLIASCMNTHTLTLAEVSAKTKRPLFEVIGFYNACLILNLIERGETAQKLIENNERTRKEIGAIFEPAETGSKKRIKIVIAGSVGSGKTTAIATLSHFAPISTETRPSDGVTNKKSTTTVAMDYGEMRFDNGLKIFLYGTPGQKRFDFMSQLLFENAWGIIMLIDNTEADPIAELDYYLNTYLKIANKKHMAIGITHYDEKPTPSIDDYNRHLQQKNLSFPVIQTDARNSSSLANLLASLVSGT